MAKIADSIYDMRHLEELSKQNSFIHHINALVKLIVSILYIITVVSYGKYELIGLIPLAIYPVLLFTIGDIPFLPLFKRCLIVLPLVIGLGLFNPILDRQLVPIFGNLSIGAGWISYMSLIIKSLLTIMCALLLISTTGIDKIAMALRKLFVPQILVVQFLLTYRYISVLLEEINSIWTAYSLRAPGQKGIHHKSWGPLLGQLLMRTYDRSQRIYNAMVLRGFDGEFYVGANKKLYIWDYLYLVAWTTFLFLVRFYDLPSLLGNFIIGV